MILKSGAFTDRKYKLLFIGALLGWIVSLLGGMADSLIAGIYLDADAVAAVGLVSPIYSLSYFLAVLASYGIAALYSKELGAFRIERSQKIAGMGIIVSVVLGILMMALMYFGKSAFLGFYDCSENIMTLASEYYDYFIWIALLEGLMWYIYYLVSFDGDEGIVLLYDIATAVLNAVFSLIFVRSMGVEGLALGTLLSQVVSFLLLVPHFFKKTNSIRFKFYFSMKDFWESVKISSAMSSLMLYLALVDIIMNKVIIVLFGDEYLTAYTVVNALLNFSAVLSCTVNAASPFITIGYGEKNYNAIRRIMKKAVKLGLAGSVILGGFLVLIAPFWPSLYGIVIPEVQAASVYAGRYIPICFLFTSLVSILLGYYPLIDKPVEGNLVVFIYQFGGPLLLAITLGKAGGFNGMCWGFFLAPVLTLVIIFLYFVIRGCLKNAPLLLPEMEEDEKSFDIKLDTESILLLRDEVGKYLAEKNVAEKLINEIEIIVEETLVHIQNKNKNKKTVLCECCLLVNDDHVRMITKDNGVIFDITKEADASLDLRCYVMARMLESASEKSNTTTSSFNRNTYIWER